MTDQTATPAPTYSVTEKRAELGREIALRRQVYRRQVAEGYMTSAIADRRIAIMEAILADYPEPPNDQGTLRA